MNKKMWKNKKIKNKLILQCISDGTWEWDIKEGKFYPSTGWKSIIGVESTSRQRLVLYIIDVTTTLDLVNRSNS